MDLIYDSRPTRKDRKHLDDRLMGFNGYQIKGYAFEGFLYKIINDSNKVIAGIDCLMGGGWVEIVSLWVSKQYRKKEIGKRLLLEAEKTAKEKACHGSYLYTYSFQAPRFYEKNGYTIFGVLENYYKNHSKFYMKKSLK